MWKGGNMNEHSLKDLKSLLVSGGNFLNFCRAQPLSEDGQGLLKKPGRKVKTSHGFEANVGKSFASNGKWYLYGTGRGRYSNDVVGFLEFACGYTPKETRMEMLRFLGLDTKPRTEAEKKSYARKMHKMKKEAEKAQKLLAVKEANAMACAATDIENTWKQAFSNKSPETQEAYNRYMLQRCEGYAPNRMPLNVRFNPTTFYKREVGEDKNGVPIYETGTSPALLLMIVNVDLRAVSLHRIYLDKNFQKQPWGSDTKKMMSPAKNPMEKGIYVLTDPIPKNGTVGVAEGFETSEAIASASGIPCYPTIAAPFLEAWLPPEGVKKVIIWADLDKSLTGQTSAIKLSMKLRKMGFQTKIMLPPFSLEEIPEGMKSIDWEDVLNMGHKDYIFDIVRGKHPKHDSFTKSQLKDVYRIISAA